MELPWRLLLRFRLRLYNFIFLVFFISSISCQPQNIETFYPSEVPSPAPQPSSPSPSPSPQLSPPPLPPPSQAAPLPSSSSSNTRTIATAVGVTAASTLVFAGLFFFVLHRYVIAKRRKARVGDTGLSAGGCSSPPPPPPALQNKLQRVEGNIKEFIVDENGLDVLYWKKLEEKNNQRHGSPQVDEEGKGDHRSKKHESVQDSPLLQGESSTSQCYNVEEDDSPIQIVISNASHEAVEKPQPSITTTNPPPPPPSPLLPLPPAIVSSAIQKNKSSAVVNPTPPPPPPPPIPANKGPAAPPPPPPNPSKKMAASPPPLPKKAMAVNGRQGASGSTGDGQVKLKPLHWDKLNTKADHSMVWDKVNNGSFSYDGDLMEALFGYVAIKRKSPRNSDSSGSESSNSSPTGQIGILDPRRSQNIAIVLRSLAITRSEMLDALAEGKGLNADVLEKLTRISPTKEEESQILQFGGDPTRLADAESFLYHILRVFPSAFTRLSAMQFRLNYDSEILHLKQTLQTLELACQELKKRGLFVKLLEAVLKAGNRMNAGTARGNAQAFNLTSLRKLSDVKSTDGKTTLLHFIVQEVIRSEGKRCVISRNRSLSRNGSISSKSSLSSDNGTSKEERENEYVKLGLPVIGGLSSEFSNVKKAATIDYDAFISTCSSLTTRTAEIREIVSQCVADRRGGFAIEMKGFLEAAEDELRLLKEEQSRVIELVKNTTEYYQAGASKDQATNKLQLFDIVKDFLGMVDQVCVEIARNMQRRKTPSTRLGSSAPKSPPPSRTSVRFPNLPEHFMKDKSRSSSSSGSDSDS